MWSNYFTAAKRRKPWRWCRRRRRRRQGRLPRRWWVIAAFVVLSFQENFETFFYFWLVSLQKSRRILEGGGLKQNWNIKLQVLTHSKSVFVGVGCGSIGRAVASDTRGPRLESSHWQKFIYILNICLLSILYSTFFSLSLIKTTATANLKKFLQKFFPVKKIVLFVKTVKVIPPSARRGFKFLPKSDFC